MFKINNLLYAKLASAVFAIILGFFGFWDFRMGNDVGGYFNAFGGFAFFVIHIVVVKLKNATPVSPLVIIFLVVMIWYWVYFGGMDGFGVIWCMVVPVFVFYAFELKVSIGICLWVLTEMVLFMWGPLSVNGYEYAATVKQWTPLTFTLLMVGSAFMRNQIQELNAEQVALLEEAKAANKAKSDFLANTSHEIRTPINAILGTTELILQNSQDEKTLEYAADINAAGQTLLSMIGDLLDISKIEAGRMEINEEEYSLSDLIRDCYSMSVGRAVNNCNILEVRYDESLPDELFGDKNHIRQMLLNLLSNAVKYTKEGVVTLSVFGTIENDCATLEFCVSDTGIGISKADMPYLFDKFVRFENDRNRNIEGTGLGLAITSSLAKLLGSEIKVESELGRGSSFSFKIKQKILDSVSVGKIDLSNRTTTIKKVKDYKHFDAKDRTVLVVDDVASNIKLFTHQLHNTQATVVVAMSGEEAVEKAKHYDFDLVFLDKMMPGMDGSETLQAMKKIDRFKANRTPVVMVTADATGDASRIALEEGFTDFITKPVSMTALEGVMEKYLR